MPVDQIKGCVRFVGAGPGDPDLLTVRGLKLLQQADVVVHDALVSTEILSLAQSNAQLIPVIRDTGDTGESTGRLLVELSRQGLFVVRLKGGDPSIFARLSEELLPVCEAGIPFEIVPGITAATAAAAMATISLTSRSNASAVAFVTGHECDEKSTPIDFERLASFQGTIVIYMGVEKAATWSAELIRSGMSPDTPVSVVSRCSLPHQSTVSSTLLELSNDLEALRLPSPAVIIIGQVVTEDALIRRTSKPLLDRTILVTRPQGQSDELIHAFTLLGARCIQQPTIDIVPPPTWELLDHAIQTAWSYDWIVFLSVNGVASFVSRMREAHLDGRALGTAKLAAIGPGTHRSLLCAGLQCDYVPNEFRAEGLANGLRDSLSKGRFLLIRANRGRDLLRCELERAGHVVDEVVAYTSRDIEEIPSAVQHSFDRLTIDWITVTSSSIAESAIRLFGPRLQTWKVASISPITTATLIRLGVRPTVEADSATTEGIVQAILRAEKTPVGTSS